MSLKNTNVNDIKTQISQRNSQGRSKHAKAQRQRRKMQKMQKKVMASENTKRYVLGNSMSTLPHDHPATNMLRKHIYVNRTKEHFNDTFQDRSTKHDL